MSYEIKNLLQVSRYAPKRGKNQGDKVLQAAFVKMRIGPTVIRVGRTAKFSDEVFASNKNQISHLEKIGAISVTRLGNSKAAPKAAVPRPTPKRPAPVEVAPEKVEPVKAEPVKVEIVRVESEKEESAKVEPVPVKVEAVATPVAHTPESVKEAPTASSKPVRKKTTSPRQAAKKAASKRDK